MSEQWHLKTLNTLADIKARKKGVVRSVHRHDGVRHANGNQSGDTSNEGGADVGCVVRR